MNLDDLTILRFTHSSGSAVGGIEQYLEDLDRMLLNRNKVQVIRMYLEEQLDGEKKTAERIGRGNLVKIALEEGVGATQAYSDKLKMRQSKLLLYKDIFRELIVYNAILHRLFFQNFLRKCYPRPKPYEAKNAREKIGKICQEYKLDLIVMHHLGGVDSAEIIEEAKRRRIPYIFLNHFSNERLSNISVREQLHDAAGIAGVSGVGVPKRLKGVFCNLSDGIDTEKFNPEHARSLGVETQVPTIIYPSRIVSVKGQSDLVKACAKLKSRGLHIRIVFAGRIDSLEYKREVIELARKSGIKDDVLFVGQLSPEELRDWYGVSSVLGFPTHRNEGLGRILIEAQAMKVVPIAYDAGGVSEGIQHERTGFLVRKGDIFTFSKRLEYLLTNEEARRQMGEEGRKFVKERFSLEALADRHEKYYSLVLEKGRKVICAEEKGF